MLSVTVMMLRDIVESVTLLKDEVLSMRGGRCFLRLRWRLRRREALLCSVELLNLLMLSSSSESPKLVLSSSLVMRVEELSYPARWRSSLEGTPGLWPPAPCSLLSLLLGRSRLSDTTDSVSVSGSRFSWLLDTLGLHR